MSDVLSTILKTAGSLAICAGMILMLVALFDRWVVKAVLRKEKAWHDPSKVAQQAQAGVSASSQATFQSLTAEMDAFSARADVVCWEEVLFWLYGPILARSVSDRFGKRSYTETQRLYDGQVLHTVSSYVDGRFDPVCTMTLVYPRGSSTAQVFQAKIAMLHKEGPLWSFRGPDGAILHMHLKVQKGKYVA